jgi:hypothetical protein
MQDLWFPKKSDFFNLFLIIMIFFGCTGYLAPMNMDVFPAIAYTIVCALMTIVFALMEPSSEFGVRAYLKLALPLVKFIL